MTEYSATLDNQTQTTWTLVIYLILPSSPTLSSVAWKLASAAPTGTKAVTWDDGLGVALATLSGNVYQQNLVQASDAGKAWKVVTQSGAQQFQADGSSMTPTTLQVDNAAGQPVDAGFALGGTGAVYRAGLLSGSNVLFDTAPQVWALLADNAQQGEIVYEAASRAMLIGTFVGPQQVRFPASQPNLVVTATQSGGSVSMALTYANTPGGQ